MATYQQPQPAAPPMGAPVFLSEPIQRPFNARGQPLIGVCGRAITVKANVFALAVDAPPQTVWWKYQVTILAARTQTAQGLPPPLPPKALLRKIWQELEHRERLQPTIFAGPNGPILPVYDGRSVCYTPTALSPGPLHTNVILPSQGKNGFIVSITNPIPLQLDELRSWYSSTVTASQADTNDCLAALNTLFHHGFALLHPANRNTFFVDAPGNYNLPPRNTRNGPGHNPFGLSRGIELWRGFFESVRTCQGGLLLNLDTTTAAFVKSGSLERFMVDFLGLVPVRGPNNPQIRADALRPADRIMMNRLLKGAIVEVNLGPQHPPVRHLKVRIGLRREGASRASFTLRGTTQTTTVEQYFLAHYNVRLHSPDLPCLEIKPGVLYPLECCSIMPGHKSNRRLDAEQQNQATAYQTLKPSERLSTILVVREHAINVVTVPHLAPFQIRLAPKPREIPVRVLAPPVINYRSGGNSPVAQVAQGAWKMLNGRHQFVHGAAFSSFGVVIMSASDVQRVMSFLTAFFLEARRLGMRPPRPAQDLVHVYDSRRGGVRGNVTLAMDRASDRFCAKPELLFWVFNVANAPEYNTFKMEGAAYGVATQAIQSNKLAKASDFQFVINLALKINGKLGGLNFSFVPGTTSGDERSGWLELNAPMIFGADLTHMENKPSIATVVGSMDAAGLLYEAAISVQQLVEPLPNSPSTRGKKQETIEQIHHLVLTLLRSYYKINGCAPPRSIVFYRDGCSDSEWPAVLDREIPQVQKAFADFKAETPACASWTPALTYILCVKRHHIRFFGTDAASKEGRNENIPAGTVVDQGVVDARAFDWYGCAHTGILGTSRPTRYVVMVDEQTPQMSPDDLQSTTNALCHAYQRCNRAVSLPAPVYYADLICTRVRSWMPEDQLQGGAQSSTGSSTGNATSRAADVVEYQLALSYVDNGLMRFKGAPGRMPVQWWL